MTPKTIVLTVVAALLGTAYCVFFTDMFRAKTIQIYSQVRPIRAPGMASPFLFSFDGKYQLKSVKVVSLTAIETNKYAVPAWHMVSDSNSVPVKGFAYATPIKGMKPSKTKQRPDQLHPDTVYRVFVEAGKAKGQIDFRTPP